MDVQALGTRANMAVKTPENSLPRPLLNTLLDAPFRVPQDKGNVGSGNEIASSIECALQVVGSFSLPIF